MTLFTNTKGGSPQEETSMKLYLISTVSVKDKQPILPFLLSLLITTPFHLIFLSINADTQVIGICSSRNFCFMTYVIFFLPVALAQV